MKNDNTAPSAGKAAKIKKIAVRTSKAALWIVGIWIALLTVLQLVLSPSVLTGIVNKVAAGHIDADLKFGNVSVSMFRHFPSATLTFEDFSLTYPSERFDSIAGTGAQGHLIKGGCGEEADTLAYIRRFSASLKIASLALGEIRVPQAELVKPRIFAHSYSDGSANWDIFIGQETPEAEEAEVRESDGTASLPEIVLGKIRLTGHPHIVYTDSRDTLFAMIDLKSAGFKGRINTAKTSRNRISLSLDSLFVAGRMAEDTVALGLDMFHIHEHHRDMDFHAKAKTFVATHAFGRMSVPMELEGTLSFPRSPVPAVDIEKFHAEVASIPVDAQARLRFMENRTEVNGNVEIRDCRLDEILHKFVKNFIPEAADVQTGTKVTLTASANGIYDHCSGSLPDIRAHLSIPMAGTRYQDIPHELWLGMEASAATDAVGKVNVTIDTLHVSTTGLVLDASGSAKDVLGEDPAVRLNGLMLAQMDSLVRILPDSLGIDATGNLCAEINGGIRLSQMSLYSFAHSDMTGKVTGDSLVIRMPQDTISMDIRGLDITLGPDTKTSRRDSTRAIRLMGLTASVSDADIRYKESISLEGQEILFKASNVADEDADTSRISTFAGSVSAKKFSLVDAASASIRLDGTRNTFRMLPKRGQPQVPLLSFTSRNQKIILRSETNRAILTDASIKARAAMNTVERKAKMKAYLDSLGNVYPDIPRDSLFAHSRSQRASRPVPDWMSEADFRKNDLDLRLDETLAKYFREWDIDGDINIRTGIVMTPYFPLRNILRGFEGHFNNNEIGIDSLRVMTGDSEIAAKGALTGLKRALLGRGTIKLDLDITSDTINANQLLRAYTAGSNFNPEKLEAGAEGVSDAEFLQMVVTETETAPTETSLIVVPANVNADISINASGIAYSDLNINSLTASMVMKERCVQITNTAARSNMGDIHFDAFYSTRTKKDLKAGFSLNFVDITAEKVISLMPAVDTLMPMLKSFKGLLNCEMAATCDLDTNMNIVMPTIDGVMRISGEDLTISDSDLFRSLARKLLFKNRKEGKIEKMVVEGLIKDNTLEVFPFVMKLDRYTLAMSGVQNLDMSFRYHVSILRSPFLIRLGVDLSGQDFDNMKFRIGKAKYKSTNVPVFTTVVDQTKINLLESIKGIFAKGVDAAIMENRRNEAINGHKKEIGYVQAVDQKLEELSPDEQKQLEEQEAQEEAGETAAGNTQEEVQE